MNFKRIIAYIIDVIIVSAIVSLISSIKFFNPTIEQYNTSYSQYEQVSEQVLASESNIDPDHIISEISPYYYKVQKYQLPRNVIHIFCIIGYFIIFNLLNNGQTLGKKLMKIRIVANKGTLTWKNYVIRNIIFNELLLNILLCAMVFLIKDKTFYLFSMIATYVSTAILIIDVLMMIFRKDKRSLHDVLSNTNVIEV